ncbi:alpha-hydroxy-acid oxidizing protein [Corallococcus sp. CA047B]|uniref:alpha-hydroxy acid oxidase n=1 Tax=Corallococcus sp. CA047B TaxID=2316729 RepID=UPI000EA0C144|nr:alpha-hydroxy acid oxidase [Corallococcus sp. CA047B]RKH11151.1 alpha-hydroxy-acid oxidizing protein [Corallococcus sp. CA047B]
MRPLSLDEYEQQAREKLPADVFDYVCGGSDDECSLRDSRRAFEAWWLRPNVLVDVSRCDTSVSLLGTTLAHPLGVAPMAYQCLAHPDGEEATARAAGALGGLMVVSTMASRSLEDVARAASGPLWFQVYCFRERAVTAALIRRAEAAGYRALVLTVDTPRLGRRMRDVRSGFGLPAHVRAANFDTDVSQALATRAPGESGIASHAARDFDASLTWESVAWVRSVSRLPVVLKGVLTAEDAERAVAAGVDGLIVSNHGGRQLDGALPPLEALPEVVAAVRGRCEVLVDGGIRRGTDVLKALALGAKAVLVGRPVYWGLAAGGEEGVGHLLSMLREELELALALSGRPTLASLDASVLRRRAP